MTTTGSVPGRGEAGEYTQWQAQPASRGQREAARDHVTRLRQHGGTYRSIAAAAALSPATVRALATGRRRAQPATATAVTHGDQPHPAAGHGWTRPAPGCGCGPCTSWATARPASPAPPASTP